MKVVRKFHSLRFLLIVLFASYYVGGTAFTHTHYYPTYSVTHSHPFLPGADGMPHHTHSSTAFSTIETLNHIVAETFHVFAYASGWILLAVFVYYFRTASVHRPEAESRLRAPPAVL